MKKINKPFLSRTGFAAAFLGLWSFALLVGFVTQPLLSAALQWVILLLFPLMLWARLNDLNFKPTWLLFYAAVVLFSAIFNVSDYSLTFSAEQGWISVLLTAGLGLSLSGFTYLLLLGLSAKGGMEPTFRGRRAFWLALLFWLVCIALSVSYSQSSVAATPLTAGVEAQQ